MRENNVYITYFFIKCGNHVFDFQEKLGDNKVVKLGDDAVNQNKGL